MKSNWSGLLLAGIIGGVVGNVLDFARPAHALPFAGSPTRSLDAQAFTLRDEKGANLAELKVGPDGNPVFFLKEKGSASGIAMYFRDGGPTITLEDRNGTVRIAMRLTDLVKGPTILLADEKGRMRTVLGKMALDTGKGGKELTGEGSLLVINENADIGWRAPPEYEIRGRAVMK